MTLYRSSRSTEDPAENIPFSTRTIVGGSFAPGEGKYFIVKKYCRFVWGIRGEGETKVRDRSVVLRPDHFVVWLPGEATEITALSEWELAWWVLDGPDVGRILNSVGITESGVYYGGPAPVKTLSQLHTEIKDFTASGQLQNSALTYELICQAAKFGQQERRDVLVDKAVNLIERQLSSHELSVDRLSEMLDVNRFDLARRFKEALGVSPIQYITHSRIQFALDLIANTELPIAEIGRKSGYPNPNYFAKLIRQTCGRTPRELRKEGM